MRPAPCVTAASTLLSGAPRRVGAGYGSQGRVSFTMIPVNVAPACRFARPSIMCSQPTHRHAAPGSCLPPGLPAEGGRRPAGITDTVAASVCANAGMRESQIPGADTPAPSHLLACRVQRARVLLAILGFKLRLESIPPGGRFHRCLNRQVGYGQCLR
jgi:hypothetical protein